MKTNSKKYLQNIQSYILERIDGTDYEVKTETKEQKIQYLFDCFESEYNYAYNKHRYPNLQTRLANWLSGLPSCIDLPFSNYDIIKLSKTLLEVDTLPQKTEERILANYWNHMSYHILKLNKQIYIK